MRIVATTAASYADAGYLTIIDGMVTPRWFLEPLRDALHTVAYAVLRAPLHVCATRAANRQTGRLTDLDAVEQMWHQFTNLGALEAHVIDTEHQPPSVTAQTLASRLADGSLDLTGD